MRDTPLSERRERERKGGKEEREYARLRNEDGERDKGWRKEEVRGIMKGERRKGCKGRGDLRTLRTRAVMDSLPHVRPRSRPRI